MKKRYRHREPRTPRQQARHVPIPRLVLIILAALALATAAACSSSSSGGSGGGSSGQVLGFQSFVWHGTDGPDGLIYDAVRVAFQKDNPGVTVDNSLIPFDNYFTKTYSDMVAGAAPDIANAYDPQILQWAHQGLLTPLNPYLRAAGIDVSKMLPSEQLAIVNGQIYGVLHNSNPRVLVYNSDLFGKAHATVPTNFDQLKAAMKALTMPSSRQYALGTVTGNETPDATYLELMPYIAGFGGAFVTDGHATANSPQVVAALDFLKSAVTDGQAPKGQTQDGYRQQLAAGKVAMAAIGPFIIGTVTGQNPSVGKALKITTLPLPSGRTIAVSTFLTIPKGAKHKALAAKFIVQSLQAQYQQKIAEAEAVPASPSLVPASVAAANPIYQTLLAESKHAVTYAPSGAPDKLAQVTQIITDNFQQLMTTSESGQAAANTMQSQLKALLGS
jgi:multiple sugar transport system substrate-binding protein